MMTRAEERAEFWMLTKGILQDSRIDVDEARVMKRWLEEHGKGDEFAFMIDKLNGFLADGYIDPRESSTISNYIGRVLVTLGKSAT